MQLPYYCPPPIPEDFRDAIPPSAMFRGFRARAVINRTIPSGEYQPISGGEPAYGRLHFGPVTKILVKYIFLRVRSL